MNNESSRLSNDRAADKATRDWLRREARAGRMPLWAALIAAKDGHRPGGWPNHARP